MSAATAHTSGTFKLDQRCCWIDDDGDRALVVLAGLQTSRLNGCVAKILGSYRDGRVAVRVLEGVVLVGLG